MIAIMNTVDSIKGIGFPKRGCFLFATKKEALRFAADAIRPTEPKFYANKSDKEVLEDFQSSLGLTEFFHIERVVNPPEQVVS